MIRRISGIIPGLLRPIGSSLKRQCPSAYRDTVRLSLLFVKKQKRAGIFCPVNTTRDAYITHIISFFLTFELLILFDIFFLVIFLNIALLFDFTAFIRALLSASPLFTIMKTQEMRALCLLSRFRVVFSSYTCIFYLLPVKITVKSPDSMLKRFEDMILSFFVLDLFIKAKQPDLQHFAC